MKERKEVIEQIVKTIEIIKKGNLTESEIIAIKKKAKLTDRESGRFFFFDYEGEL